MNVVRTHTFTHNIRLMTVPELTEDQYYKLLNDEEVEVEIEAGLYLIKHGYAIEIKEGE